MTSVHGSSREVIDNPMLFDDINELEVDTNVFPSASEKQIVDMIFKSKKPTVRSSSDQPVTNRSGHIVVSSSTKNPGVKTKSKPTSESVIEQLDVDAELNMYKNIWILIYSTALFVGLSFPSVDDAIANVVMRVTNKDSRYLVLGVKVVLFLVFEALITLKMFRTF
jgi:hypothetical protein